MAASSSRPELLVIVGPTASGKSELAIKIAKKYNGEIIAADSRTIYKGMDIGTAKPAAEDQKKVKHWGLDLISPSQKFSAKQFQEYAELTILDIQKRGKLPIIVGGTGLYVDAVIFTYDFSSSDESDPLNPRHRLVKGGSSKVPKKQTLILGVDPGKEELKKRIRGRADKILGRKMIAEVKNLSNQYDVETEVFKTPGYAPTLLYLEKKISLAEAKKIFVQNDLKLAKKQRTWFKRNKNILWHTDIKSAGHTVDAAMNT